MDNSNCIEFENSFITSSFRNTLRGYKLLYKEYPPIFDIMKLIRISLYAKYMCDERLESHDETLWREYIGTLSPNVKRWVLDSTSIYLGMDYNKLNTNMMLHLLRDTVKKNTQLDTKYVFYSFDGSMYDKLYIPWKEQLEQNGVKFLLNHDIKKIYHVDGLRTISSINVVNNNSRTSEKLTISGDIFINAMDTSNLSNLYPNNEGNLDYLHLHNNSKQFQTQVLYKLPYRLQPTGTEPTILVLPDSPWFLMMRIEGDIWETKGYDLLSCGIGMFDVMGINGKMAIDCTREQLAEECWSQITASKHNLKLPIVMPKWNIWDSYVYNNITGKLTSYEPKFSNNINTLKFRPKFHDKQLLNLYHATSYTKTETNIYNMEGAAEAGVKSANIILNRINKKLNTMPKKKKVGWFTRFMRTIDRVFFLYVK